MCSNDGLRVEHQHPDDIAFDSDHVLAAILDVLAEVEETAVFGAAEVLRAIRPAVGAPPRLEDVGELLALLALPVLGGVTSDGDGTYRVGAPSEVVLARLFRLTEAVQQTECDDLCDRY